MNISKNPIQDRFKFMSVGIIWYLLSSFSRWKFNIENGFIEHVIHQSRSVISILILILVGWAVYYFLIPILVGMEYTGIRDELITGISIWIEIWLGTLIFPIILIYMTLTGIETIYTEVIFHNLYYPQYFNSELNFFGLFFEFVVNILSLFVFTVLPATLCWYLRIANIIDNKLE